MNNVSNFNLDAMVAAWAVEIFEQASDIDDAIDLAYQYADGSEWVIYHHKAHELCAACNTDLGEDFIAECGEPDGGWTYNSFASAIAFGEIYERLQSATQGLYTMEEEMA